MDTILYFCLAFLILIFLFFCLDYFWSLRIGKRLLIDWAEDNEFTLLDVKYRLIKMNPFSFNPVWKQRVFWVRIKTPDGIKKNAWVLVGDRLSGLRIRKFDIKWIT